MKNISATRAVASTFGVLVGLAGMEHGFFEMLQGNVTPSGIMIDAIGTEQRFWEYATETALTIIPNFLITGILSKLSLEAEQCLIINASLQDYKLSI